MDLEFKEKINTPSSQSDKLTRTIELFENGAKRLRELGFIEEACLNDNRLSELRRQLTIEILNKNRL